MRTKSMFLELQQFLAPVLMMKLLHFTCTDFTNITELTCFFGREEVPLSNTALSRATLGCNLNERKTEKFVGNHRK